MLRRFVVIAAVQSLNVHQAPHIPSNTFAVANAAIEVVKKNVRRQI